MTDSPIIITANSSRLDVIANHAWLAVGDAAIAFDPLSGQGVYKAIQSAINAATAINKHFAGDSGALPDYATSQEGDFARYLETHRKVYSREKRWANSPFWSRRQSSVK